MDWTTKIKLGMELIHEGCEEDLGIECENCPFETYCDIIYGKLQISPDQSKWIRIGGEDIR